MITNSSELSQAMNQRSELEDKKKSRRLNAEDQEKYTQLIYDITEYLSNEDNLLT